MALLVLVSLFVASLNASANDSAKATIPPFPLTAAEEANARAFAQRMLTEKFLPSATRSPEFYHVQGVDLSEPRLGEPFLDVVLRRRSISDYRDSPEDDPRLFPGTLRYCFPVFVADRADAIIWIVVPRNRDEDRNPFRTFDGEGHEHPIQPLPEEEFIFFGYYFGGSEGRAAEAVRLRKEYGCRISFVEFMDTHVPLRIIVDAPSGVLSGAMGDTLKSIREDAPKIKHALR